MKYHVMVIAMVPIAVGTVAGQEQDHPLQGDWTVTQMERGGQKPPPELLKTLKVTINGDKLIMSDGKRRETAVFFVKPAKRPREIDLVFHEGPKEDVRRTALGIYELDAGKLKLAWRKDGGPRPTEFNTIRGERTSELLILKRARSIAKSVQ